MRVIDRYLIRGFLWAWIYCLSLFFILFIIIDAFNNLDDYLKNSVPLGIIFSYYLNYLPVVFVQLAPVVTVVALLTVLGNFNKHREIIALKSSGVSAFHLVLPYLFIGFLLSFGVFLVSEMVVPQATATSTAIKENLIEKGRKIAENQSITKNVTLYGKDNRIIYAREFDVLSQTLHEVIISEDTVNQQLKSKITAKRAQYQNNGWVFYDVMKYRLNRRGEMIGEPSFTKEETFPEITEKPENFTKESVQVEFMNARQLKAYLLNLRGSSNRLARRLWVDFYAKHSLPFMNFVLILVAAPLAMKRQRGGLMSGIGMSLAIIFLYYTTLSVSQAMGKGGWLPPIVSAWGCHAVFAGAGLYLIGHST